MLLTYNSTNCYSPTTPLATHLQPTTILATHLLAVHLQIYCYSPITMMLLTYYSTATHLLQLCCYSPTTIMLLTYNSTATHLLLYFYSPITIMLLTYLYTATHLLLYCYSPITMMLLTYVYTATHLQIYSPRAPLLLTYKSTAATHLLYCYNSTLLLLTYNFTLTYLQPTTLPLLTYYSTAITQLYCYSLTTQLYCPSSSQGRADSRHPRLPRFILHRRAGASPWSRPLPWSLPAHTGSRTRTESCLLACGAASTPFSPPTMRRSSACCPVPGPREWVRRLTTDSSWLLSRCCSVPPPMLATLIYTTGWLCSTDWRGLWREWIPTIWPPGTRSS